MTAGTAVLTLPAVLDVTAAGALRDDLIARRGADLDIDASAVTRFGGLCLQVLLAAAAAWRDDGRILTLAGSDAFLRSLRLFGAEPHFSTRAAEGAAA